MGLTAEAHGVSQSVSHCLFSPNPKPCVFCIWTLVLFPSSLGGHHPPSDPWASRMVWSIQSLTLNTAQHQRMSLGTVPKHLKFHPSERDRGMVLQKVAQQ